MPLGLASQLAKGLIFQNIDFIRFFVTQLSKC
jgi:hypothetical protein